MARIKEISKLIVLIYMSCRLKAVAWHEALRYLKGKINMLSLKSFYLWWVLLCVPAGVFASTPISIMQANSQINRAMIVLDEIMQLENTAIPAELMQKAHGLIISPDPFIMTKVANSKTEKETHRLAVVTMRDAAGDWSHPLFISFVSSYNTANKDVILVLQDDAIVNNIDNLPVDLCAQKPIIAGTVGRNSALLSPLAKIFGYTRHQGMLEGVLLTHAVLKPEPIYNKALYNRTVTAAEVFSHQAETSSRAVKLFQSIISKHTQ